MLIFQDPVYGSGELQAASEPDPCLFTYRRFPEACQTNKKTKDASLPGGIEPPISRLTVGRLNQLGHGRC